MSTGWAQRRVREHLTGSLGERLSPALFSGFLIALGGALLRGGGALVSDPPVPGRILIAEFDAAERIVVQIPGPH